MKLYVYRNIENSGFLLLKFFFEEQKK